MVRCTIIQGYIGGQPPGFSGFLDQPRRSRKKAAGLARRRWSGELAGEYRRILKGANWLVTGLPQILLK
jgi:hypothetical protein